MSVALCVERMLHSCYRGNAPTGRREDVDKILDFLGSVVNLAAAVVALVVAIIAAKVMRKDD